MLEREQAQTIVDGYMKALIDKDLEAIVAMYSEDASVQDPVGTDAKVGTAAIREFYTQATSMDIQAELTGPIRVAGTEVAFPFVIKIASGEAPMQIQVIDVFDVNADGKVVSMRAFWGPENCSPLA